MVASTTVTPHNNRHDVLKDIGDLMAANDRTRAINQARYAFDKRLLTASDITEILLSIRRHGSAAANFIYGLTEATPGSVRSELRAA